MAKAKASTPTPTMANLIGTTAEMWRPTMAKA